MIFRGVAILIAVICFADGQRPEELYGRWKVTAMATASPITAMSGTAASHLIGHVLTLAPGNLQFDQQTCRPTYATSKETLSEVASEFKIDTNTLNLPQSVIRVDADCTELFIRDPKRLVFEWKGYLFEATRMSRRPKQ